MRHGDAETRRHGDTPKGAKLNDCVNESGSSENSKPVSASPRLRVSASRKCPVCGEDARREKSKFCAVCGHDLRQDYAPLDALRASYNLRAKPEKQAVARNNTLEMKKLYAENSNGASATAMAFVVYSLVPYLGILFCPGALLMGGIGLAVSFRKPQLGGRDTAAYSLVLGTLVMAIQVLLWWLLYIIPELNR